MRLNADFVTRENLLPFQLSPLYTWKEVLLMP